MQLAKQTVCKKCGHPMDAVANIAPMADKPGVVAFLCSNCGSANSVFVYPEHGQGGDAEHEQGPELRIMPSGDGRRYLGSWF